MRRKYWISLILVIIATGILLLWLNRDDDAPVRAGISAVEALQADPDGFLQVTEPREFAFPEDHGPHEGYRTEWWYYTGNLSSESGRRFGFQFTLFRNQFLPDEEYETENGTGWSTNQLYLAHLAITDVETGRHIHEERFSRGAAGLAGAQADPFRIWLEDWMVVLDEEYETELQQDSPDGKIPMHLVAATGESALDLKMSPSKPPVFHGDRGFEPKGPASGDASYYLSFTRLVTTGTIEIDGEVFQVEGLSWMDHEWSTSALAADQAGWDWFSLQLSDGYDLMFYHLRNEDGTISPFSTGTLVDPEGVHFVLDPDDFDLEATGFWESPHTGATYPVSWQLQIPGEGLQLDINTLFENQEMQVSFVYYEGAVSATGTRAGAQIEGRGYVEMTGYESELGTGTRLQ